MSDSERFHHTIDRLIELYGDRTEGIGDEIRAGFAWIQDTRFVLIAGHAQQPSNWRRVLRLFGLAQQFRRPVLLWDLSLQVAPTDSNSTLLSQNTIQNSQLRLLKLSLPIIRVFDRLARDSLGSDLAMVDAAVLVDAENGNQQHSSISMGENLPVLVKIRGNSSDIKLHILEALDQISTTPVETLIQHRIDRVYNIAEQNY